MKSHSHHSHSHAHPHDESDTHFHEHRIGDAGHEHHFANRSQKVLAWSLGLTLIFAGLEVVAGILSNSLALISDAGHMITDAAALGLALLAQHIAKRPPSARHSFGFGRAEALAAFFNALFMLAVAGWIVVEAIHRFSQPEPVKGAMVMIVAAIGMSVNIAVAWVLSHDKESLNTRAALVHVMGDLLGSVAALASGAIIYFTGFMQIDPILSVVVSLLILRSTVGVLRQSYHFLMQGVPEHIDYLQVGNDLEQIGGVSSVHDLHVWEMAPGHSALIGHIELADLQQWPEILSAIRNVLKENYGIEHATLQPETPGMNMYCERPQSTCYDSNS